MRLVHVCSFFNTSSLYKYCFDSLKQYDIEQHVFVPMYKDSEISPVNYGTMREKQNSSEKIKYYYVDNLYKIERFFLKHRVRKLYKELLKEVSLRKNDVLHGHSLFANGGICLLANKNMNLKYIVSFRQTDLNVYRKLPIYRELAKEIIKHAERIVFISYSLKKKFLDDIKDKELIDLVNKKGIVIPNGINEQWFFKGVRKSSKVFDKSSISFVYQGTLHSRKNVNYIIDIIEALNEQGINSFLEIIGGGPEENNIQELINRSKYNDKIILKSWTNNFDDIVGNYKKNDIFIMPSSNETFGISYLEALAVGLPIVYKKEDGIDGFFDKKNVGTAIKCENIQEDISKIIEIINNYDVVSKNTIEVIEPFSWDNISIRYYKIYNQLY